MFEVMRWLVNIKEKELENAHKQIEIKAQQDEEKWKYEKNKEIQRRNWFEAENRNILLRES